MDKYSLLKRSPSLLTHLPKPPSTPILKDSLYALLEKIPDGRTKGLKVEALDGKIRREYLVEKYERYKAGLMGRVWLSKIDKIQSQSQSQTQIQPQSQTQTQILKFKLVDDKDALGFKWRVLNNVL